MKHLFFKPTPRIDDAIKDDDTQSLIAILVGIINRDPTFATSRFDEAYEYICSKLGRDLFTEDSDKSNECLIDSDSWDTDYFGNLLNELSDVFSRRRFENVKKVGKKVFENKDTFGKEEAANLNKQTEKTNCSKCLVAVLVVVGIIAVFIIFYKSFFSAGRL